MLHFSALASLLYNLRIIEKVLQNKPHSCAWTNLNKFDLNCKRPKGQHETVISTLDNILLDELKIVKPDFILFYTGPNFDERIKRIFTNIKIYFS